MHLPSAIDQYERGLSLSEIAKLQGTSASWVSRCLTKIAIHNPRKSSDKFWTADEDEIIRNLDLSASEAAARLPKRTVYAVRNRRKLKGMSRNKPQRKWTKSEVDYIRSSAVTDYKLGLEFGVSGSSIKSVRKRTSAPKIHLCVQCGKEIGAKGRYCRSHRHIGHRASFYKNRITKIGGNLTHEQIRMLLISPCVYCGANDAMGIDRVDSLKGYTPGNTVPACGRCNVMKLNMTTGEWLTHMRKILEHFNGG